MPTPKPRQQIATTQITETHLRKYFFIFFFAILLLFYPGQSFYTKLFSHNKPLFSTPTNTTQEYAVEAVPFITKDTPSPFVTADAIYVIDLETATPLLQKNEHKQLYPASTVKVITALTAYDVYGLDDVLEVKRIIDEGQSMDLLPGERMTFENLLYGALVHSGNDAAYMIADNYPQGYDAFIKRMNEKAQSLGMKDSRFTNAAGIDDSRQYSSAFDLALAGRELLKNKTLSKIVSTKSITVSDVDFIHFHALYNVNRLLGEIPGVAGLKTGKTDLAGENLITLYKNKNHEYLLVLLKSEDRFLDTQSVVQWIQTNVRYQDITTN
jgi:serine-type D-Ala-D-Ala carboxypeptidase (penicillin-binding protein 5/6)